MGCHIQISNLALSFSWKSFNKAIFKNLDLCLPQGLFVTVIGSNGSGKSSLIKLILGLLAPDTGEVLLMGEPVRHGYPDSIRTGKVAYLSQQIEELFFSETPAEELNYGDAFNPTESHIHLLQKFGLDQFLDRPIENLSGGERQSLALLQFMLSPAQLLILDEPSSYLDQDRAALLHDHLQASHGHGKTIIHVTQYHSEIAWGTHLLNLDEAHSGIVAV